MYGFNILSGGARTVLELANKLVERGHEVTITSFKHESELRLLKKINFKALFKFNFAPIGGSFSYRVVKRLLRGSVFYPYHYVDNRILVKKMPECDINVGTMSFTASAIYESGKGKPFHHAMHYEPILSDNINIRHLIEETYYLPTVKIVNSSWLQNAIKNYLDIEVSDENIVHPGFLNQYFFPRPEIKKNPNKKRILSLGKKGTNKGLADILAAFRMVYEKNKNVELVLFTGDKLINLPDDLPIVVINSPMDEELGRLYNTADVLVCPSWLESFPAPPIEAMFSGVPVVTTRFGVEDFAVNEENALVIDPKVPQQMANAIMRILDDSVLREKLIENGLKTPNKFTYDAMADKVEKIFKSNI